MLEDRDRKRARVVHRRMKSKKNSRFARMNMAGSKNLGTRLKLRGAASGMAFKSRQNKQESKYERALKQRKIVMERRRKANLDIKAWQNGQ